MIELTISALLVTVLEGAAGAAQDTAAHGQERITFQAQIQDTDATSHALRTHTAPEDLEEDVCSPRRKEGRTAVRNKGTSLVATILSPTTQLTGDNHHHCLASRSELPLSVNGSVRGRGLVPVPFLHTSCGLEIPLHIALVKLFLCTPHVTVSSSQ
ncbi:hypothetical protein E2C01_041313 [Portunus trituberculatus]|uniref:Uncharacterized protein n=1 Tax=Portunus trituberculatus TaxID=210409 RepID=A0A5B7FM99_PORTR|nr:hypothetical protein [Portunus trituberculatus]